MSTEQVLCVPTEIFRSTGDIQGFFPDASAYLREFFELPFSQFRLRSEAESDPNFKQIIPYCLLVHEDRIFVYERGKKGGEARLTSKLSMGIGGHINPIDQGDQFIDLEAYENAVQRELLEEVKLKSRIESRRVFGIINDDSNSVGQVHLGIVEVFFLDGEDVTTNDPAVINCQFLSIDEIAARADEFESWSGILAKHIHLIFQESPIEAESD